MEYLIEEINREMIYIIRQKHEIDKMKEDLSKRKEKIEFLKSDVIIQEDTISPEYEAKYQEIVKEEQEYKRIFAEAGAKTDKLEKDIIYKKISLLTQLKRYFSVIDESEKQFLANRKKQFLESNLEFISKLIDQIHSKFDIDNIEKIKDFLDKKKSEILEEKSKKMDDMQRKWNTYYGYYNRCVKAMEVAEDEEIKDIVDKIIIILKRNIEIVSNEYTIIKDENIMNYIEMTDDRQLGKVRSIKEKMAKISGVDIESSHENLEIQNEKNKKLYKDDAKKLRELIYKLETLIKSTQNENSQETMTLQEDSELQENLKIQKRLKMQNESSQKKNIFSESIEKVDGVIKKFRKFKKFVKRKIQNYKLKKFDTYSKEKRAEEDDVRTWKVVIEESIIDNSKEHDTSIKTDDSIGKKEEGVCEKAGDDVKKMLDDIAKKHKERLKGASMGSNEQNHRQIWNR